MQIFVIDWSLHKNEDQLFTTNKICQYINEGKLKDTINGFKLMDLS